MADACSTLRIKITLRGVGADINEPAIALMRRSASDTLLKGPWMQLLLPALNRLRDVINYLLGVLIELRRVSRHRRMLRHLMLVTVMLRSNH